MMVGPSSVIAVSSALRSSSGIGRAHGVGAEAFRELDEVGIVQVRRDEAAAVPFLLLAVDVGVAVIVEHHGDQLDAVFNRRREFGGSEQEAAIAGNADHHLVGIGRLDAERGGIAIAERALEAATDMAAQIVDRQAEPGGVADLGDLVAEDAVGRQNVADRLEIGHLRPDPVGHLGIQALLESSQFLFARSRPPGHGALELGQEDAKRGAGIAMQRYGRLRIAIELMGVDVEPDDLDVLVEPPIELRVFEPGADGEDHVGVGPEPPAGGERPGRDSRGRPLSPGPERKLVTGASIRRASWLTSGAASTAPPPT